MADERKGDKRPGKRASISGIIGRIRSKKKTGREKDHRLAPQSSEELALEKNPADGRSATLPDLCTLLPGHSSSSLERMAPRSTMPGRRDPGLQVLGMFVCALIDHGSKLVQGRVYVTNEFVLFTSTLRSRSLRVKIDYQDIIGLKKTAAMGAQLRLDIFCLSRVFSVVNVLNFNGLFGCIDTNWKTRCKPSVGRSSKAQRSEERGELPYELASTTVGTVPLEMKDAVDRLLTKSALSVGEWRRGEGFGASRLILCECPEWNLSSPAIIKIEQRILEASPDRLSKVLLIRPQNDSFTLAVRLEAEFSGHSKTVVRATGDVLSSGGIGDEIHYPALNWAKRLVHKVLFSEAVKTDKVLAEKDAMELATLGLLPTASTLQYLAFDLYRGHFEQWANVIVEFLVGRSKNPRAYIMGAMAIILLWLLLKRPFHADLERYERVVGELREDAIRAGADAVQTLFCLKKIVLGKIKSL